MRTFSHKFSIAPGNYWSQIPPLSK